MTDVSTWVLVGLAMGSGWVVSVISIVKNQILQYKMKTLDVDDVVKRLKLKEQYVTDLEEEIEGYRDDLEEQKKETASWTGRYHQKGQIKKLPANKYDLTKKSDIGLVAEDILNQVEDSLDPDLQKVIKDPKIRSLILDYANEHPDEAMAIIKNFISQSGKGVQSSAIPNFDSKAAI